MWGPARRIGTFVLLGATIAGAASNTLLAQNQSPDADLPRFEDEVEVRLITIDAAVVDPKQNPPRYIPGLAKDHFQVFLDGRPLDKDRLERLTFEEVCADEQFPLSIIIFVDFNYLDPAARFDVAREIETILELERRVPTQYKIYGLGRQLTQFTNGFTQGSDPLKQAIQELRQFGWIGDSEGDSARTASTAALGAVPGQDAAGVPTESAIGDTPAVNSLISQLTGPSSSPEPPPGTPGRDSLELSGTQQDIQARLRRQRPAEASLSAFEAVLRANQWVKGRKLVMLFSTDEFSLLDKDRNGETERNVRDLAQSEVTIWTVNSDGLRSSRSNSNLMAMLAKESGGEYRRQPTELFVDAVDREVCYYSFSLPISAVADQRIEQTLHVRLDTKTYPEMWNLRVIAPERAVVFGRKELNVGRRIAALLDPDDFATPPVNVSLGPPVEKDGKWIATAQVHVPLSRLTWLPSPDGSGSYRARLSVDAVLLRQEELGDNTVCEWGADKVGAIGLVLPGPPANDFAGGLVVELECAVKRNGEYVLRAVLNDIDGDQIGAGRSGVSIDDRGSENWEVREPKLMASSGREFVWRPGKPSAVRDRSRTTGREIGRRHIAYLDDTLHFNYLLCGPSRARVEDELLFMVLRSDATGEWAIDRTIAGSQQTLLSEADIDGPFCVPARITIPEQQLSAGQYQFVIAKKSAGSSVDNPEELGVLARLAFTIGAPPNQTASK